MDNRKIGSKKIGIKDDNAKEKDKTVLYIVIIVGILVFLVILSCYIYRRFSGLSDL